MSSYSMGRVFAILLIAFAVAVVAPRSIQAAPPPWFIDEESLPFDALPGATAYWGTLAGSGYRIEVPDNWNGDLVMYAHGFRGFGPRLFVSNPRIRAHLIANGYAWAASSYAANGYVPGQGAKDTYLLAQRFNGLIGLPNRVYITGHSMGGHVTGVAIGQWPEAFAGALPMCGVMGDNELFDYFLSQNLISQKLAGVEPQHFPETMEQLVARNVTLLSLLGPEFPRVLNPLGERYAALIEHISGGDRPIFNEAFAYTGGSNGAEGTYTRTSGTSNRTNVDTIYQFDADPALTPEEQEFNETILRVELHPSDRFPDGIAEVPRVTGNLPVPVLSIHTLGDLFVPFSMEQIYARRAAEAGKADLLVVRAIRDVNHCGFNVAEESRAFDDLVEWVVNGVKPDGDDILDPATVADRAFGCQFTVGTHFYNQNFGTGNPPDFVPLPACP